MQVECLDQAAKASENSLIVRKISFPFEQRIHQMNWCSTDYKRRLSRSLQLLGAMQQICQLWPHLGNEHRIFNNHLRADLYPLLGYIAEQSARIFNQLRLMKLRMLNVLE
ncbi:hypothetical protein CAL11_10590 [Bordetella genomosp. 6]|nr:hypothetical protein CAL11_10590 [Bordetella genomosp. 6]